MQYQNDGGIMLLDYRFDIIASTYGDLTGDNDD